MRILNKYIEDESIHETIEIVSPKTGLVIKEINSIEEIEDFKSLIYDEYDLTMEYSDENIVEAFLENYSEYIYYKYSVNREKINQINESKNKNIENIAKILRNKLDNNEAIFETDEEKFWDKIKGKIGFKKKAS